MNYFKNKIFLYLFIFISTSSLAAKQEDSLWNDTSKVCQYHHNSDLQLQWAMSVFGKKQTSQQHHNILDYGCGDGKITALLSSLHPEAHVTGIELSESMLEFAKNIYPSSLRPNLSFEQLHDTLFNEDLVGEQYDMITSFCVFHLVQQPEIVIKNISDKLTSGGELVMTWPLTGNNFLREALEKTLGEMQIPSESKQSSSLYLKEDVSKLFSNAGLEIQYNQIITTQNCFYNTNELENWLSGTLGGNFSIEEQHHKAFFKKLALNYTIVSNQSPDKTIILKNERMDVIAKKA
jgi:trans-aconitate 2-methyltransferase